MTVKSLIAALNHYDPNLPVWTSAPNGKDARVVEWEDEQYVVWQGGESRYDVSEDMQPVEESKILAIVIR